MRCGHPTADAPVIDWFERAALGASTLCLLHCVGLPLVIAALPAISKLIALPESFHLWVLAFAAPTACVALLTGHRHHRAASPLVAGGVGLAALATGALILPGGHWETVLTVAGSLSLAFAHIANWRLRHRLHTHG